MFISSRLQEIHVSCLSDHLFFSMYLESELPRGIQIGTEQCMSDMWQNFKSYHPHEHISIEHSMTN